MDKIDKTKNNIDMEQKLVGAEREENINLRRRNFVKIAALGSVAFLAGKFFGPHMDIIKNDGVVDEKILGNFKIIETDQQLNILDKKGNEILVIDKDSF